MDPRYAKWIADYLSVFPHPSACLGKCQSAIAHMMQAFPELVAVPGHVHVPPPWGKRGHWWCVAPDGTVVDPTAAQFPAIISYEPYKEDDEVRLGKCMECGVEIWGHPSRERQDFCVAACALAFSRALERETF